MTMYSQDLDAFVYTGPGLDSRGRHLLKHLYGLRRIAPGGCHLSFVGTGSVAGTSLVIHSIALDGTPGDLNGRRGRWDDQEDSRLGNFGSAYRKTQEAAADRLFVLGNVVTVYCDHYSVYAHASYLVERDRVRWGPVRGLLESGHPEYYTPP